MGIGIYVAYLLLSIALTIAVGTALSRSGRVFLTEVLGGNQGLAVGRSTGCSSSGSTC